MLVGVLDTGIDGTHPDIAPNFNAALSRNFTVDIPLVDGPCAAEADGSCNDAANVDENGHGTHVAGTIASPLNGLGMAGVAPNVRLVNLRAGQDSGYFFLQPSIDALTFAGDHGIDVVNMSYFIDPWLYNCTGNPADSATAQAEQRTIIEATTRALDYARSQGRDAGRARPGTSTRTWTTPRIDVISPDFPPGAEYDRTVDNSCLTMPTEGPNVVSVGAVGPSTTKADYSNWGAEGVDVTAPGGYFRDLLGTPQHRTVATQILGPYPLNVAIADGDAEPGRDAEHAVRRPRLQGRDVRLLPVHPGHLDGLAARRRRRRADRQPLRASRSAAWRARAAAAPDGEDPHPHRDAACMPGAAGARLHERRPAGLVHGDVCRHRRGEQHLGRRASSTRSERSPTATAESRSWPGSELGSGPGHGVGSRHGRVHLVPARDACWVDVTTTDIEGTNAFYSGLFGWSTEEMPNAGGYTMYSLRGKHVAAGSPPPPGGEGVPPHWTTYLASDDADETAEKIRDAGGAVLMDPFDVFDSGRMTIAQDPTGAAFGIWQAGEHIGAELANEPGTLNWNQCQTDDPGRAAAFYAEVFGYEIDEIDIGGGEPFRVLKVDGRGVAGVREHVPQMGNVPPHWSTVFAGRRHGRERQ